MQRYRDRVKDGGERGETLELLAGLLAADGPERLEAFHRERLARRGVSLADAATARLLLLEIVHTLEQGDPDSCERIALALDATLPRADGAALPPGPGGPGGRGGRADLVGPGGPAPTRTDGAVQSASLDGTMPAILSAIGSVDATLPALAPPAPPPGIEVTSPASERPSTAAPTSGRPAPDPLAPGPQPAAEPASAPRTPHHPLRAPDFDDDPLSVSVDDTVMFGHLDAIDLEAGADPVVNDLKVERWAEPSAPVQPTSGGRDRTGEARADDPEDPLAPQLDLDRYAVLCAWTELQPERRADHNRQYGLPNEEARRDLDESFEELFAAEPSLRAELQRRMQIHLRWLKK